jgi:hypothetical protein
VTPPGVTAAVQAPTLVADAAQAHDLRPGIAMTTDDLQRRRRNQAEFTTLLEALSDDQVAGLMDGGADWRRGVGGGRSGLVEVGGRSVFLKTINVTALELANRGSTANLYALPTFYQYGVGSAGFGVWREMAVYEAVHAWVLAGDCPHFPLVCHWRLLPRPDPGPPPPELRERLERGVRHWGGSDAIRRRLEAIFYEAPARIALFLEPVANTLEGWLAERLDGTAPGADDEAVLLSVFDQLHGAAAFMNARGLIHFDLHALNVLTDGAEIFVTDFGLATCAGFDLSPDERAFFEAHALYDRAFASWAFWEWLARRELTGPWPPRLAALIETCRPVADLMRAFIEALRADKTTPYPAAELAAALTAQFAPGSPASAGAPGLAVC